MESRIRIAIEFLKENQSFRVGDLRLGVNATEDIQVTGWSNYTNFQNLTKTICIEELNEVKQEFSEMIAISEDLRCFVNNRVVEYSLEFDDNGKASISICLERDNLVTWHVDLK